ncbi:hypothetical protein GN316_27210 [Xylophilus sp. Kf1]|nr:hypothetical protein [Xylophilus sp. Kf1]
MKVENERPAHQDFTVLPSADITKTKMVRDYPQHEFNAPPVSFRTMAR